VYRFQPNHDRTVPLAAVLALYVAVLGRGPMGRLLGGSGFDPSLRDRAPSNS
jgi:hypothetical protein